MNSDNPDNHINHETILEWLKDFKKDVREDIDKIEDKIDEQGDRIGALKTEVALQNQQIQSLQVRFDQFETVKNFTNNNTDNSKNNVIGNLSPEIASILKILAAMILGGLGTAGGIHMNSNAVEVDKQFQDDVRVENIK